MELCNDYWDVFDTPLVLGTAEKADEGGDGKEEKKEGEGGEDAMEEEEKKEEPLMLVMGEGKTEAAWSFALARVVLFGAIAEYSNHQQDLLQR